jgi:hypothetical protein
MTDDIDLFDPNLDLATVDLAAELKKLDLTVLDKLQRIAYLNSVKHGFWDGIAPYDPESADKMQERFISEKMFLVVSEGTEAFDEHRSGHALDHTYYSYPPVPPSLAVDFPSGGDAREYWESKNEGKPEGVPSELADGVIRSWDLSEWGGQKLSAAILEKMLYNIGRPYKHGKNF